jgi:hypothetical protein
MHMRACTVKAVVTAKPIASGFFGIVWGSDRNTDVTVWPTSRLRAASGATFNCLEEPRSAYAIGEIDAENYQRQRRSVANIRKK